MLNVWTYFVENPPHTTFDGLCFIKQVKPAQPALQENLNNLRIWHRNFAFFSKSITMAADKKIERDKLPHPEKNDKKNKSQEEFDEKAKSDKDKTKSKKVNYVVKDLPIY